MLDRSHYLYQLTRKLSALRRSCPPLAFGRVVWKDAEPANGGILAYSRVTEISEMVIIVNPGGTGTVDVQQYNIDSTINKVSGQKYVNVFAPSQVAYTTYDFQKGSNSAFSRHQHLRRQHGSLPIIMFYRSTKICR